MALNDFFVHLCAQNPVFVNKVHPHSGDGPVLQPCAVHFEHHGLLADHLCWQIKIRQTIGSNQLQEDSLIDMCLWTRSLHKKSNTVQS